MKSVLRPPPAVFVSENNEVCADRCLPLEEAALAGDVQLGAFSRRAYPGKRLPEDRLLEVCTIGYWDTQTNQNWGLDWHFNEGIEFTLLKAGRLAFSVDQDTRQLEPGDLTITRPWQRHRIGDPHVSPSRLYWFILDVGVRHPHTQWQWPPWLLLSDDERDDLTNRLRGNETPVLHASPELIKQFGEICSLIDDNDRVPETRLKLWVNNFLLEILQLLRRHNQPLDTELISANRTVQMVLDTIRQYPEREWSLDGMAREADLSRSRFGETCKSLTNRSPMDFLGHCRVEKAAQLLQQTPDRTLAEIAAACGFHSAAYFCNQFKRRKGASPKSWLSQQHDS